MPAVLDLDVESKKKKDECIWEGSVTGDVVATSVVGEQIFIFIPIIVGPEIASITGHHL